MCVCVYGLFEEVKLNRISTFKYKTDSIELIQNKIIIKKRILRVLHINVSLN